MINGTFSIEHAIAYNVEGDISGSFFSKDESKLSILSFTPTLTLLYLSVFAVQRTITLSTFSVSLNSLE